MAHLSAGLGGSICGHLARIHSLNETNKKGNELANVKAKDGSYKKNVLKKYLRLWQAGKISKEDVEVSLGITTGKGKTITRIWNTQLGVDTRYHATKTSGTIPATNRQAVKV